MQSVREIRVSKSYTSGRVIIGDFYRVVHEFIKWSYCTLMYKISSHCRTLRRKEKLSARANRIMLDEIEEKILSVEDN